MNQLRMPAALCAAVGIAVYFLPGIGSAAAQAPSGNGATVLKTRQIASDTPVMVKILQPISSETARVGDTMRVVVAANDASGLPAGTVLIGRVTRVEAATVKKPGVLVMQFGVPDQDEAAATTPDDKTASAPPMAFADTASLHLTGKSPSSEKSQYTSIGAGAGAVIGLARKGKLGDAVAGAILGGAGGYAADQAQKHPASDISLPKGSETTLHMDTPLIVRTEILAPY